MQRRYKKSVEISYIYPGFRTRTATSYLITITELLHEKRTSFAGLHWPSSRTLTTSQQQAALIRILNTLASTSINTVYLQVRPESDALYASTLEPWSYWLTNAQGTAPNLLCDPLQFAVAEAHARGMQLHAWLNP